MADTPDTPPESSQSPDFLEAFRQVGESGQASLRAGLASLKALRSLFTAELALARGALGRSLAFTAVAIVAGAVGGLLLTATLVALLVKFGLSIWLALLSVGLFCLVIAGLCGWLAMRYFAHTRFRATRRQLARLGLGDDDDEPAPPGTPPEAV